MTEPPTEPNSSATPDRRGSVEPSADAADRGARCGPPIPHDPLPRSLWGRRALLLIPVGIGVGGVYGHLSTPADTVRLTLVAIAGTALLALLRLGWWGAAQPELTQLEANRVHTELGREDRRLLQRALRRGDGVPAELRPWVPAYLALDPWPAHTSTFWLPVMPANLLLFTARTWSPSTEDIVLTGMLVMLMAVIVARAGRPPRRCPEAAQRCGASGPASAGGGVAPRRCTRSSPTTRPELSSTSSRPAWSPATSRHAPPSRPPPGPQGAPAGPRTRRRTSTTLDFDGDHSDVTLWYAIAERDREVHILEVVWL